MLKKMFLSVILLILGVVALGNFSPAFALDTGNVSLMEEGTGNEPPMPPSNGEDDLVVNPPTPPGSDTGIGEGGDDIVPVTPGGDPIVTEPVHLGSVTAAQFNAGLQSAKLIVTVYTEDWSPIVDRIYVDSGSNSIVRSVTPVVTLPYTVSPNLNGAKIHLANVVLGSDGYLPAGRYSAKIVIAGRTPGGSGVVDMLFTFDIIDDGNGGGYDSNGNYIGIGGNYDKNGNYVGGYGGSGYDGPTNVRDAIGCSASGLGVFGVLALAGLALSRRRRP